MDLGAIIFQLIFISLTILFFVSLYLFVKSMLKTQKKKIEDTASIEKKLDRIIELLEEKEHKNKA